MRGEDVRCIQTALVVIETNPPCGTPDGVFGPATQKSVKAFQADFNLTAEGRAQPLVVDGIVGSATWGRVLGKAAAQEAPAPALRQTLADLPKPRSVSEPPPLNQRQTIAAARWMNDNFGPQIKKAIKGTPIAFSLVAAIACKETAAKWLGRIGRLSPDALLASCVFDASGDFPGTSRGAFPRNTAAFRAEFGDQLTDMLIAEANKSRALDKFNPKQWVYKGYGIFQYDLQHIKTDEAFFREKQWASMEACLAKMKLVLLEKIKAKDEDMRAAIAAYNGAGERARTYAEHVLQFNEWIVAELGVG
jgi:hypothetical protein